MLAHGLHRQYWGYHNVRPMIVPPVQVCSHTYLFVRLAALTGTITVCILSFGGGKVVSMVFKLALRRNGIVALGVSIIV